MTRTLYATYDGEVIRPDEPVPLPPNTRLRVTIESEGAAADEPYSFFRLAQSLELDGPEDWSSPLEDHLYADDTDGET